MHALLKKKKKRLDIKREMANRSYVIMITGLQMDPFKQMGPVYQMNPFEIK